MNSFLEVRGVKKSFGSGDARVDVLKGIDLDVAEGETIALVGASGAGKSTLLHIVGTLDRPSAGDVMFRGEDLFRAGDQGLHHSGTGPSVSFSSFTIFCRSSRHWKTLSCRFL